MFGFNSVYAAESCESRSVKLSHMKFLNASLSTLLKNSDDCTIIDGVNSDKAADSKCNKAALNPGNPQYGITGQGQNGSNSLGYYFCLNMNKQDMCLKRKAALGDKMDIRWAPLAGAKAHHNSGDCKCKSKGDSASEEINCPSDAAALIDGATTGCTVADSVKKGDKCHCSVDNSVVEAGGKCPTEPPKQVTENVDDNALDECVADLKAAKATCSEKAKAAIDKCSKEAPEVNKNISQAQRVLSIGLDAIIAQNAGTGALDTCAKMGAAGTSAIEALSFLRDSCKKELEGCKKGCEDVATLSKKTDQEYSDECKVKFNNATPRKLYTTAHETRLVELLAAHRELADNSEKFCKGDAQKSEGQLDNFLQELALRVQKADICKCQLTASSTENCDNVVGPLACIQNINQAGCSFSSVGCSPDSTVAGCRISAINPNGSGIAMPASGFAGPGFGSGSSGNGAGKVNIGDGDFSGLYDETRPSGSGTATADAGSPFGVAAGGGSGGGGGGGSGEGGGGGGAAGEEKDKGGLSGFFQNTKAGIASLFGGGADNKGSAVKKPDNKAYKNDVNGFRPKAGVRGVSNEGTYGGKNRDIWKTMNDRYNDQYHTFITVESPPK